MAEKFTLNLVSPEKLVLSAQVESVIVSGAEGDFEVLAHHSPFMSIIRPGALTITQDNKQSNYELNGGFIDVTPQGVTILAETINQK